MFDLNMRHVIQYNTNLGKKCQIACKAKNIHISNPLLYLTDIYDLIWGLIENNWNKTRYPQGWRHLLIDPMSNNIKISYI